MVGADSGDPTIDTLVPHRAPILQLQRVVKVSPDAAEAAGPDPGPSGLPWELGAIEGIAQTAAVLHGQHAPPTVGGPVGMLVGVRGFVFHHPPAAGAERRYRVELVRRLGPAALVRGYASADGEVYATGELKLWNTEPGGAP